ncbi:hypothetical protein [Burkholderia multivorans]|uniref:hypothetical protein n=1 Tax=Burkholderia multivorans TaxID=87883 RepID=UPI000668393F|nr:hypothetical protein [Burkholderia multivorans]
MAKVGFSGGDALERKLREIAENLEKAHSVRVGFLEGATYPGSDTPVAMVAAIQEYGAPAAGIRARPYFRPTVEANKDAWSKAVANVAKAANYDAAVTLGRMGEIMGGELREAIIGLDSPALSKVTLLLRERFGNNPQEIKFSDVQQARKDIESGTEPNVTGTQAKPLVWTGHMLNSVSYQVDDGEKVNVK